MCIRDRSVPFHQSGRAHRILQELSAVISAGYEQRALQRSPHLVLLNLEWYRAAMQPIMARWVALWLEANHVSGLSSEHVEAYLMSDGTALIGARWDAPVEERAAAAEAAEAAMPVPPPPLQPGKPAAGRALRRLYAALEARLSSKAMRLLNLAAEWLRTYLPHALQKIDRVSYGLLSQEEYKRLAVSEPHMPRSRVKLAIPFLGKDVPSQASEFAHPDVILGLTVLAYRYEGLRLSLIHI